MSGRQRDGSWSPPSKQDHTSHRFTNNYKTTGLHGDNDDEEEALLEALRGLHLPNMPSDESSSPPTIRILAVADVDLPSAAALAEFALRQQESDGPIIGGGNVDLCIAVGPFCHDTDLLWNPRYLQGYARERMQQKLASSSSGRLREETAALEGLVTAALSQLESIVCRVVFVPGPTDPISVISPTNDESHLRLTANARNVHRHWLQLAPGLGCTGLLDERAASRNNHNTDDHVVETLSRLLGLAHPTTPPQQDSQPYPPAVPFANDLSQAILLTTKTNKDADEFTEEQRAALDDPEKRDEQTWSVDYLEFLDSPLVQHQVVLHVFSGEKKEPYQTNRGNVTLVEPGSLRERGDFCLMDVGLCEYDLKSKSTDKKSYHWRVNRVQFRNIPRAL